MKPIYFPFTFISGPVLQALAACFRQTIVYQPSSLRIPEEMHKWAKSGVLDIKMPVKGHEDKLAEILKDYENWANHYHKGALDYFKARRDDIPFFDKEATSRIRAQVKDQNRASRLQDETEELLNVRVFLHMAQEFDLLNNRLSRDLATIETMEQNFISNLKGADRAFETQTAAENRFQIEDSGLYMTAERLKAWACLGQYDHKASGLYITASRSVFDEVMDDAPEAKMIIGFDAVPVFEIRTGEIEKWQDDLAEHLAELLINSRPLSTDKTVVPPAVNACDKTISIKFFMIAAQTPSNSFARWAGSDLLPNKDEQKEAACANTIVGIIEF